MTSYCYCFSDEHREPAPSNLVMPPAMNKFGMVRPNLHQQFAVNSNSNQIISTELTEELPPQIIPIPDNVTADDPNMTQYLDNSGSESSLSEPQHPTQMYHKDTNSSELEVDSEVMRLRLQQKKQTIGDHEPEPMEHPKLFDSNSSESAISKQKKIPIQPIMKFDKSVGTLPKLPSNTVDDHEYDFNGLMFSIQQQNDIQILPEDINDNGDDAGNRMRDNDSIFTEYRYKIEGGDDLAMNDDAASFVPDDANAQSYYNIINDRDRILSNPEYLYEGNEESEDDENANANPDDIHTIRKDIV